MTDRDDRHSDDRPQLSSSENERARKSDRLEGNEYFSRGGDGSTHQHDATDPEVPSAKRKGARKRQGSFIALLVLVAALLTVALSLLYRAGEKVRATSEGDHIVGAIAPAADHEPDSTGATAASTREPFAPKQSEASSERRGDAIVPTGEASDGGLSPPPTSSVQPKMDPPASDMIRTPAF